MPLPSKLTVGSTFGIYPPRGGGQLRILNLYRNLASRCPVDVVALVGYEEEFTDRTLAPGLREIRVPKSRQHAIAEAELEREVGGIPITDVAFPQLFELTPAYANAISSSLTRGAVFVASHPYTYPAFASARRDGVPIYYDAHNVEVDLKASMLPHNQTGQSLLAAARGVEQACCERAELIFSASADDHTRLMELYGVAADRFTVIPNGVDTRAIRFTGVRERTDLRQRLRLKRPLALFIGAWHEPNVLAVQRIIEFADELREVDFVIAGSVGWRFADAQIPANVSLAGVVGDEFKDAILSVATVGLNPVSEGSGTNMKMLDYLAAGVPVISTPVGARGIQLDPHHVSIVGLNEFVAAVRELLAEDPDSLETRVHEARTHIERHFDWTIIAGRLISALSEPQLAASV